MESERMTDNLIGKNKERKKREREREREKYRIENDIAHGK